MLHRSIAVQYHGQESATFHDKRAMVQFLNEIAALGYHLVTLYEQDEAFAIWRGTQLNDRAQVSGTVDAYNLSQIGISTAAYSDMETFIKTKGQTLSLIAFSVAQSGPLSGFKLILLFNGTTSLIRITPMTVAFASRRAESVEVFTHWLNLFTAMYLAWHPTYGYSFSSDADWPDLTDIDIQSAHIPYLYEINFFGAKLAEKLGRKQLLSTPGWKVQLFDDGGVLVVPEFIFATQDLAVWQAATRHLGMDEFFRGRYC